MRHQSLENSKGINSLVGVVVSLGFGSNASLEQCTSVAGFEVFGQFGLYKRNSDEIFHLKRSFQA